VLSRRRLAALAAGAACLPLAARAALPPEKRELVQKVEDYLNRITTLAANFSQINPDGSASSGKVYVDRQRGAMLFDYDPPSQIRLIAPGDWRVIFQDASIKQENVIPVGETPLGFLLSKQINLVGNEGVNVKDASRERGEILLDVARNEAEDQGRVRLAFIERPMELRRWAVTDAQGLTTVIIMEDLQLNRPLDRGLFQYRDPKIFGWGRR
jgi:outer membrane lipoprotein-sorting protein